MNTMDAVKVTQCWIEKFVIGLNLCPFAAKPWNTDTVRVTSSDATDDETLYKDFLTELDLLIQKGEEQIATTVLAIPHHLQDFEDYLDFIELTHDVLTEAKLDGIIQIASFHPEYLFEGEDLDSTSHHTNRSPYPMLHLIREEQLEAAVASYPDPENIPSRNIQKLEELGIEGISRITQPCAENS